MPARFFPIAALLLLVAASGCKSTDTGGDRTGTSYLTDMPIAAPIATRENGPPAPIFTSLSPVSTPLPAGVPSVVARSVIVIDHITGAVLYEKNADARRPVASTQKLLTGLVITAAGGLDRPVRVDESDTLVEPSKLGLGAGEVYPRSALLRALIIRSGNDVAHCLARTQAGSEPAFAMLMNQRARQLGMFNSNFANASGLPVPGQYSTARDLGILARHALRDPVLASFMRTRGYTFRFADGRSKVLENTNKLLLQSPYCHGMKTGWTRESGRCLVSCGTRGERTVIIVVLYSTWEDVWDDSRKLLHWGLGV